MSQLRLCFTQTTKNHASRYVLGFKISYIPEHTGIVFSRFNVNPNSYQSSSHNFQRSTLIRLHNGKQRDVIPQRVQYPNTKVNYRTSVYLNIARIEVKPCLTFHGKSVRSIRNGLSISTNAQEMSSVHAFSYFIRLRLGFVEVSFLVLDHQVTFRVWKVSQYLISRPGWPALNTSRQVNR